MDKSKVTYVYADKLEEFRKRAKEQRQKFIEELEKLKRLLEWDPDLPVIGCSSSDNYDAHDGDSGFYFFLDAAVLGCKGWDRQMFWFTDDLEEMKKAIEYTLRGLPENWQEELSEDEIVDLYVNAIPWTNCITVYLDC